MIRTQIFAKVTDSEASPFIEQKDVILCRSGIQLYSAKELESWITESNKPPKPKKIYKEYRPASVIVKAKDKFRSLPVTKEHPDVWVNPDNWKDLAGGVLDKEVDVVALEGESEGEIGLKSNVTFYTNELYEYYLNNKETSVGYTCKKHFVDNPEEVGYDILLDEIVEVNHLAITRAGRGGSSVAVIDSIIGGLKPMRTGFFAFLSSKKAVNKDSAPSFGKEVLEAVKNSKGTTEEEIAGEMKGVLDSMSELKDCDAKDTLMNVVKDCFDNKDKVLANEAEVVSTLDSMWVDIHSDSLGEIAKAFAKLGSKSSTPATGTEDNAPAVNKDSDEPKDGKDKDSEGGDKKDKGEPKKGEDKDSEGGDKKDDKSKDGCNKDSANELFATKDDILALKKEIGSLVTETVKECLGIKEKNEPTGSALDSATKSAGAPERDYSSFLD
jgi:hypothetical protein